jgi:orotate phosphoribosyltransferase-like protein
VFYLIVTAEDQHMSSVNNNYDEREKKVLELYDQGKSTRDIAKELRISLRDISVILRKNQSHKSPSTDNGNIDYTNRCERNPNNTIDRI